MLCIDIFLDLDLIFFKICYNIILCKCVFYINIFMNYINVFKLIN